MITSLTITDPVSGMTSVIRPRAGIVLQGLEVQASPRVVAEDYADSDGAYDTTQYLTSAAVTLNLAYPTGDRGLMDEVASFCVPSVRPYLVVSDDQWLTGRQLALRFDSHAHPIATGTGLNRVAQYQFKAPRGLWEDTALAEITIPASVAESTGIDMSSTGMDMKAASGLDMGAASGTGDSLFDVPGNARPHWVARLYGPATGPKLANDATGEEFAFLDQLVLAAGDYVELDSQALTVNLLSEPDSSRLQYVDWVNTQWPSLMGGQTARIRYHATSGTSASSQAFLTVSPVWMP